MGRTQLDEVKDFTLTKGDFVSLEEIAEGTGYTPVSIPAISARLRDLRKQGYTVSKVNAGGGQWLYKVEAPIQVPVAAA